MGIIRDGSKCFSGRFRDGGEKKLILTPAGNGRHDRLLPGRFGMDYYG